MSISRVTVSDIDYVVSFGFQVKNHPVKVQPPDLPGSVILAKEPVLQVSDTSQVAVISSYTYFLLLMASNSLIYR